MARRYNLEQRAHDYTAIITRWLNLAKKGKFLVRVIAAIEGYDVLGIRSLLKNGPVTYLSAGIHGDEPAGVWGMLEWCEENLDYLKRAAWFIFPCLNPWGLVENQRCAPSGKDLNRSFQTKTDATITGWKQFIGSKRFTHAITLHEDFDARGIYAYQLGGESLSTLKTTLTYCSPIIPLEARPVIDNMAVKSGIIRLFNKPGNISGLPEARCLFAHHTKQVYIFESPSEYSFYDRVKVHKTFLENMLK